MGRVTRAMGTVVFAGWALTSTALASAGGTPVTVSHTGFLLDAADQPLQSAGVALQVRLYDAAALGTIQWEGSCAAVPVMAGYYSVVLGGPGCAGSSAAGLDPTLDTSDLPVGAPRWLELTVSGVTLAPRVALSAVPSAAVAGRALSADLLGTHPASDFAPAVHAHAMSDVTGLQAVLDAKAVLGHTHTVADIAGLQAALDTKLSASTLGALSAGKWCTSDGAQITCTSADPREGFSAQANGGTASPAACGAATAGYFWYDASVPAVKVCNGASYVTVSAVTAPPGPPAAPTVTRATSTLNVAWSTVSGATSYEVGYQAGSSVGASATVVPVASGTSASLSGLTNGTTYAVAIRSVSGTWKSAWSPVTTGTPAVLVVASGGTTAEIAVGGTKYRVHTFTGSGTFTVSTPGTVEYLVVAGGGGGGGGYNHGGGGGAGGLQTGTLAVSAQSYAVTVGAGGGQNADGAASSFATVSTVGGGAGCWSAYQEGRPGGSGGGGCALNALGGNGTAGQGYKGGTGSSANLGGSDSSAGGGGGAGGLAERQGSPGPYSNSPGQGGAGIQSSITGTALWYAAGGNGAGYYGSAAQNGIGGCTGGVGGSCASQNGAANTGSGGGGGRGGGGGGSGSAGVVIVRYEIP